MPCLDAAICCRIRRDKNRKWQSMCKSHLINFVKAFWVFLGMDSVLFKILKSIHHYFLVYIVKRICSKLCSSLNISISQYIYASYIYSIVVGGKRDTAENFLASTSWLPRNVGLYEPKWKEKKSLCIQNLLGANLAWQWDESWIHASFNIRGLECSLLSTVIK